MNRLPEAIDAYNLVIQKYPSGDQVDMAYYRRGFVESQMGRTDAARATFEEVVKRFPDSQGAQLARQRLAGIEPHPLHRPPSPDLGCHSPIVDFTRSVRLQPDV